MGAFESANELLKVQMGHDVVIALATCSETGVNIRNVNGYYKDGFIYVVTHSGSQKMKDVAMKPNVALCKDLMCAHGLGENLGNPLKESNIELRNELKEVFFSFYDRHVNENDPGTCILKITLTDAVAFSRDTKYIVDFSNKTAVEIPFVNDIIS